ncbi:MAG: 2-isopropylmalate synthase [Dehalococcoidia bacterium]|jgi:2-isopropylmalate synthase|nr:MAG: 2-isopropylmalate synthase [Chloroflexota bacterium]|tara:strand:- start:2277 stop:3845 length:1569 start_codon:yes stop_codon:yes gene_type:complete
MSSSSEKIYIFDTTLRDGEQSAGIGFTKEDKLQIAHALNKLNVDIIEAGFPASSIGDLEAVAAIAREIKGPVICGLARANEKDIDAVWEAVRLAESPRIHVFLSSSDIHMAQQLHKNKEDVIAMARTSIAQASKYCSDIEFSPMDATRSDPDFVYQLVQAAIEEGATTINIPDTVGYAIPEEFSKFISSLKTNVKDIDKVRISVHCQNDLGMATANSIAGIMAGARQVEGTINGIGERAGNASLEEIIMTINTRQDIINLHTNINTEEIYASSKLVERLSGMHVQSNKAIVGKNAFRHSSGIHQDGVLKMRETYEIIDPKTIGLYNDQSIVLTKVSGRHGLKARLDDLGIIVSDEDFDQVFNAFKDVADKKNEVDDRDLEVILSELGNIDFEEEWILESVQVSTGDNQKPTAAVELKNNENNKLFQDAAIGDGPIDAICKAINRIVKTDNKLTEYRVKSVTEGIDAQGEVAVSINYQGQSFAGNAAHTDILVASAKAYMNALNKQIIYNKRREKKGEKHNDE